MAEQVSNQPVYYTKEFSSYGNSVDNFVANQEITVTVTLNEYRELIKANAVSQNKLNESKTKHFEVTRENEKLKTEIQELKSKVYELQNPAGVDYE